LPLADLNPQTRFPAELARLLAADEYYVVLDIGARGGFETLWDPFRPIARFIGFEPDVAECDRLNRVYAQEGLPVTLYPRAIARDDGVHRFYETRFPASSGLLRANPTWLSRLPITAPIVVRERDVECMSLGSFVDAERLHRMDFIKLDVEGSEYDILDGAREVLNAKRVLGLKVEVWWHSSLKGQPPFAELDLLLQSLGLHLFDIEFHRNYYRHTLPFGRLTPNADPSSHPPPRHLPGGQLLTGDALYFRDPVGECFQDNEKISDWRADELLRLCGLFDVFGYPDCALEVLEFFRDSLLSDLPVDRLKDTLVPPLSGQVLPYDEYLARSVPLRNQESRHHHGLEPWQPPCPRRPKHPKTLADDAPGSSSLGDGDGGP